MNGDDLLTTAELAKYLRIRRETIVRKARKGELPSIRIGRQFRFDRDQIKSWINKHRLGGMPCILVVDDDPQIGKLFRRSLEEIGISVTIAFDDDEAINLITKEYFDLVFIDLKLPDVNGNGLFARIRETNKELPVIVITAHGELMEKARPYGPLMALEKPFGSEEIFNAVSFLTKGIGTNSNA